MNRGALVAFACILTSSMQLSSAWPHQPTPEGTFDAISTEDVAALVDLEAMVASPDGRWAIVLTRQARVDSNQYEQAWMLVSLVDGSSRRLADAGEIIMPNVLGRLNGNIRHPHPVWSPDSRWIAFVRRDGGRTQAWRVAVQGGSVQQLTSGHEDVRALIFSRDGRRLLIQTEPSQSTLDEAIAREGLRGYLYDERFFPPYSLLPALPSDVTYAARSTDATTSSQASAQRVVVIDFRSRRHHDASVEEIAEFESLTAAIRPEGRDQFREHAAASPTSTLLSWTEARDPEQQGGMPPLTLVAQTSPGGEPVICDSDECTGQMIRALWWRSQNEVIFARGEGVQLRDTALYSWQVGTLAPRLIMRTQGVFLFYQQGCAITSNRLICLFEDATHPTRLVAIDLRDGTIETLFNPNPNLDGFAPNIERVEFESAGIANYGYVILPPNYQSGRLSLVIVTYRCDGFLRGGTGDEYPIFALAGRGHAVLCFNTPEDYTRLATADWEAHQRWARGPGDAEKILTQSSLETAISYLDRRGIIDPTRVALTGLSFGAETVTYAAFHMPTLAAVAASGTGLEPSHTYLYGPAGEEWLAGVGLDDPMSDRWRSLSLAHNARSVIAPMLFNVPDTELLTSLEVFYALRRAGRSVEMFVYPREYHIKWQPVHRLAIYERNIDWMDFWLLGREREGPGKASQYERWRTMRFEQCERFGPGGPEYQPDAVPWYCTGALREPLPTR